MMTRRSVLVLLLMASSMGALLNAQVWPEREVAPLQNWAAPPYWQPTEAEARETLAGSDSARMRANAVAAAASLPVGANALVFVPMTPCRVVDTRSALFPGLFGPPHLTGGAVARTIPIPTSTKCSIPALAQAYSFNVTVVPPAPLGYLTVYPAGQPLPVASTLNALQGQVVGNAAIVAAGTGGAINVFASNNTELIIDINGYYAPPTDSSSSTALGSQALSSNTSGFNNTAMGASALAANTSGFANTATGQTALSRNTSGYHNTAYGTWALRYNVDGNQSTAVGSEALASNTSGAENTAVGTFALVYNTTGTKNIAVGSTAAYNVDHGQSNNIHIGSAGTFFDSGIIRIGTAGEQIAFFAAGVKNVTTNFGGAVPVLVDSQGQFGTASSSRRYKEDIADMGDASNGLLRLRPVTFRYRKAYADGSKPLDYGLIAEEVAEVYPDLVARSADGQIETVQYQKLAPMLLNELQKQQETLKVEQDRNRQQGERIRSLESRLAILEELLTARQAGAAH